MRGEGRGKHPEAALRIAINAINMWSQQVPYWELPTLPHLKVLRDAIANEIVRELTRRGAPTTKDLLANYEFKPMVDVTDINEDPLRWMRDDARADAIRWITSRLEQSCRQD